MNKVIFIAFLTVSFLINCSDNITNPDPEPGRRDYTWTVDTINAFNGLKRLWGSSPTDVWAITYGTFYEDIYHFDGTNWSTNGVFRFFSPSSIWGFSQNNIYIGGGGGKIWHYDGNEWEETAKLTKDGHTDIVFDNMWGDSPEDLYAFGAYADDNGYANNSVIAHYNSSWKMLITDGLIGIVEHLYKDKNGKIYLQVIRAGAGQFPDSTMIYEYYKKKYTKLYGNIWTQGLQADISIIDETVYFVLGDKISTRVNNKFETYLQIDSANFYQRIWGRNSKDIFLLMTDGLMHYNGSGLEYLLQFDNPRTQIFGSVLFETEVFFLVYESPTGLSLIYHGILDE